jgi:hypothetical protein
MILMKSEDEMETQQETEITFERLDVINFQRWFNSQSRQDLGVVGIGAGGGIQIKMEAMTDWAPIGDWTLNKSRDCKAYPYKHSATINGISIFVITEKPICIEKKFIEQREIDK